MVLEPHFIIYAQIVGTKGTDTIPLNNRFAESIFFQLWCNFTSSLIFTGLPDTNVEGDLKVEHQNCEFKFGLLNLAGKWKLIF